MSFTKRGVQCERSCRGMACSRAGFLRRERRAVSCQREVRSGEPGIREGIIGVLRDGLLEIVNRLVHPTGRPTVPIEPALQVQLVGLGALSGPLSHEILLSAGKSQLQIVRDVASNIRLQGTNVV